MRFRRLLSQLETRSTNDDWRDLLLRRGKPDFERGKSFGFQLLDDALDEEGQPHRPVTARLMAATLCAALGVGLSAGFAFGLLPREQWITFVIIATMALPYILIRRMFESVLPISSTQFNYICWIAFGAIIALLLSPAPEALVGEITRFAMLFLCIASLYVCMLIWRRPEFRARSDSLNRLRHAHPELRLQDTYLYATQLKGYQVEYLIGEMKKGADPDDLIGTFLATGTQDPKYDVLRTLQRDMKGELRAILREFETVRGPS